MHPRHVQEELIHHVSVYPIPVQRHFGEDKSKEHWHNIYHDKGVSVE